MAIQHSDLVRSLAFIYMRHGYHRRSKVLFELLVRAEPDEVETRLALGSVLVKCGKADKAIDVLDLFDQEAASPEAQKFYALVMSEALQDLGRIKEAQHFFDLYRAQNLAPNLRTVVS